jgi:DNA segregation ATPase FtsK/SpoIIIE-like protein
LSQHYFTSLLNEDRPEFRIAAIGGALLLGLVSVLLSFSIIGALIHTSWSIIGPGLFFINSYGILAFAIPAFLFYAAFILVENDYRPDRIFILACSIIPFLTLALGFSLLRNFDTYAEESVFVNLAGRTGLSLIMLLITTIEVLGIALLTLLFFPYRPANQGAASDAPARKKRKGFGIHISSSLKEVYMEAAAKNSDESAKRRKFCFIFPKLKPLASSLAFEEFDRIMQRRTDGAGEHGRTENSLVVQDRVRPPALREDAFPVLVRSPSSYEADSVQEAETQRIPAEYAAEVYFVPNSQPEKNAGPVFRAGGRGGLGLNAPRYYAPDRREERAQSAGGYGAAENTADTGSEALPSGEESLPVGEFSGYNDPCTRRAGRELLNRSPALVADAAEARNPQETDAAVFSARQESVQHVKSRDETPAAAGPRKNPPKLRPYSIPVEGILTQYPDGQYWIIDQATREAALILKETLREFKIQAEVTGIRKGPVITMFEILPAPGVKLSRIVNLQDNIALRLAASSVRIVAPIPGKHAVGIEVPNAKRNIVSFREIIEGELQREGRKPEIPVALGKDITGEAQTIDLVQMPHLLIAGSTGSGKSVCVNSMILSILYQRAPSECRLILIDPKIVELKLYNDIPHLLTPVITEPKKAFQALQYLIFEMERRYACLDSMGVRDIKSYNRRIRERNIAAEHLPYIVVVIDEFADLMATTGKELESTVARLAAMSRAVGIHLVLATQRPSIDVITGLIKANIPSRIAFMVASKMDSRIIIDMVGAEKLLGKGDLLYAGAVDPFPIRMQGAYVSEEEVENVVEYVKTLGAPDYIDEEIFYDDDEEEAGPSLYSDGDDPLYDKALEIVTQQGKASASYIQRRLKIGYNRAARLVEVMEERGVVGPAQGSKPRELLRGV